MLWRYVGPTQANRDNLAPGSRDERLARVEAALVLADEPLTAQRLAEICELPSAAEATQILQTLATLNDEDQTAFQIEEIAGGYQLLTRPVFHPWLVRYRQTGHDLRLTGASMETLAVIAYRQPITRADIEQIRGVNCTEGIRILMEKGLVRIAGREKSLGRPQLYGTTKFFLQAFGLKSLSELPQVEALPPPGR